MQIRKCVLIEMFSLVLIGMFSPFFHIIGSRIGAFGLFPFGNVLTCHVSLGGTHTTCAHTRTAAPSGRCRMDGPEQREFRGPRPRPKTAPAPDSQERARQLRAAGRQPGRPRQRPATVRGRSVTGSRVGAHTQAAHTGTRGCPYGPG